MGATTIEWTWSIQNGWTIPGFTFNPWIGCEKISAACKNCYASVDTFARVSASRGLPLWGPGSARHRTSKGNWNGMLRLAKKARQASEILGFEVRPRVFCASLADVFEDRPDLDPWRADLWSLIERCPELDWLLLTKRPENVRRMVSRHWHTAPAIHEGGLLGDNIARWPQHVWIGTTVENQAMADERIPHLLDVPAPIRFLSVEPMLGPVDLVQRRFYRGHGEAYPTTMGIDWVIVGGESGPKARPMHPDWVRSLRDQCIAVGMPFTLKQWGEWAPWGTHFKGEEGPWDDYVNLDGSTGKCAISSVDRETWLNYTGEPKDGVSIISRVGKKASGRLLDGRTWDESPR